MTLSTPAAAASRWSGAWLDALAFALGLALAWLFDWQTTDLVWSLWLSSLVIGYATIVWSVTGPMRDLVGGVSRDEAHRLDAGGVAGLAVVGGGTLFMLAFFTVHFGGFHWGHSVFLNVFFPVQPDRAGGMPGWPTYIEVFRRYWWFLPAAALAERQGFVRTPLTSGSPLLRSPAPAGAALSPGAGLMAPYRNVVRMHLLIFFFAFAHFAHLANFAIYAVAYAVYFFPWRMLRRSRADAPADRAPA